jgi:hypothetical protein
MRRWLPVRRVPARDSESRHPNGRFGRTSASGYTQVMRPRLIIAFVVLVLAASSCTSHTPDPVQPPTSWVTDVEGWRRVDLPVVGLSTSVPDGWHVQRVDADLEIYRQYALIVSNEPFDVTARSPDHFPTLWDMSGQPPDLVAVILGNHPASIPGNKANGASMPYTAAEVRDPSHWADDFDWQDAGSLYSYDASFDGQVLGAYLWLGRIASTDDMARGVAVVTTVRPVDGWHVDCRDRWRNGWFPRAGS